MVIELFFLLRSTIGFCYYRPDPKRTVANVFAYEIHKTVDLTKRLWYWTSHDIAVLTLKEKIEFTDKIKPICLPSDPYPTRTYQNEEAVIAGWGNTEKAVQCGRTPGCTLGKTDFLLKANVRVVGLDHEECGGKHNR